MRSEALAGSLHEDMPKRAAYAPEVLHKVLREVGALLELHTPSEGAYACAHERALIVLRRWVEHDEHCIQQGCRLKPRMEPVILCMSALRSAMQAVDQFAYDKKKMWTELLPRLNKNYVSRTRRIGVFNSHDFKFQVYLSQEDKFACMCKSCGWHPVTLPAFPEILETNIRNRAGTELKGLNLLPSTVACAIKFLHTWLELGIGVRCGRTYVATVLWLALVQEQNGFLNAAGEPVTRADIAACCEIGEDTLRKCSEEIAPRL